MAVRTVTRKPDEPKSPSSMREYLTTREAAALLKRTVATLERWRRLRRPGPPYFYIMGNAVYDKADLIAWVESQRLAGAKAAA